MWSSTRRSSASTSASPARVRCRKITIQGLGLNFGGPAGFPSGRTVSPLALGDTATYLRGNHIIKFGGEYREAEHSNFNLDPGTFSYASVAAFQTGLGNGFNITLGDRAYDLTVRSGRLCPGRHLDRIEPEAGSGAA